MSEFIELKEFTPPDPKLPAKPVRWDGWGDEADKARFEKLHGRAQPMGELAVNHQIIPYQGPGDGWGVDLPAAK